jgi:hypothetical protein
MSLQVTIGHQQYLSDDGGTQILGARALDQLSEASVRHPAAAPEACAEGDCE